MSPKKFRHKSKNVLTFSENKSNWHFNALKRSAIITLSYLIFGTIWILGTDHIAKAMFTESDFMLTVNIIKGMFYILITSIFTFILVYFTLKKLIESNEKSKNSEIALLKAQKLARMGSFEYNIKDKRLIFTGEGLSVLGIERNAFLGTQEEILSTVHPEDRDAVMKADAQALSEKKIVKYDCRIIRPDGDLRFVSIQLDPVFDKYGNCISVSGTIQDITEQKLISEALRESERSKSILLSHLPGIAYRCRYDPSWTMEYLSEGCYELTGYKPDAFIENRDLSFNELICPEYREPIWIECSRTLSEKISFRYEYEILTASGERKWVLELSQGIYDNEGSVEALEGIIIDITESKQRFKRIQYMSNHDLLTNLYNRRYYEEALKELDKPENLPLSIIFADINGIRLINDTLGYEVGDWIITNTGKIIQGCCRQEDIVARIGGDDFAVLMPKAGMNETQDMLNKIKNACEGFNASIKDKAQTISLSMGFGVKTSIETNITEAEKEADNFLAMRKLLDQKSHHSAVLSSIMATMYERSFETEEHARRIADLCGKIGEKMQLPQS